MDDELAIAHTTDALAQICRICTSREQAERIIGKHNAQHLDAVRQSPEYLRLPNAPQTEP